MGRFRPVPRGGPPSLPPETDIRESLLALKPEEWPAAVARLGPVEGDAFDLDWSSWAHAGQQPPELTEAGLAWRTWVIMAGRGFGKTLAGAKWLTAQIATEAPLDIALVGATLDEARRVMVEGRSGLLEVADAWISDWQPSLRQLKFRTGAVATLFSGASPEQLRGPEHHLAWCDELAKWEKPQESWDMLQFGLRLGDWPRAIVTTTPRPGPVLAAILGQADTVQTGGPTSANPHVSEAWQRAVHALYAGTRLGAQELEGKLLPDKPGALWSVELLERCRIASCRAQGSDCGAIASQRAEPASVGQPAPCNGDRTDVTGMTGCGMPHIQQIAPGERSTQSWSRGGPPSSSFQRTLESHCLGAAEGKRDSSFRWNDGGSPFTKLVIAVDPPAGDGTCGIIACARDADGTAHLLADHSVTARSPEGWARAVADAVRIHTVIASPAGARQPGPEQDTSPVIARTPDLLRGTRQSNSAQEPDAGLLRSARNDDGGATSYPVIASPAGARQSSPTLIPLVVAEQNQGGKLVKSVLHTADPTLRVKLVTATVGKSERAAPVAMLFEAGKVLLHGRFPELEAVLLGMIAGGDYQGPGKSPDRADAMVWGLTELMLQPEQAPPRIRSF